MLFELQNHDEMPLYMLLPNVYNVDFRPVVSKTTFAEFKITRPICIGTLSEDGTNASNPYKENAVSPIISLPFFSAIYNKARFAPLLPFENFSKLAAIKPAPRNQVVENATLPNVAVPSEYLTSVPIVSTSLPPCTVEDAPRSPAMNLDDQDGLSNQKFLLCSATAM